MSSAYPELVPPEGHSRRSAGGRAISLGLLVTLLLGAAPGSSLAQVETNPGARIQQLYELSRSAYFELDLVKAREALLGALSLSAAPGVDPRSLARVHLMLGIIHFAETRDETQVDQEFVAAVALDPQILIEPELATPTLEQILERARLRQAALRPRPSEPLVLEHARVTQAHERVNIPVVVELRGNDEPVQRIVLRYRRPGGSWEEMDLIRQQGQRASGYIPGSYVSGDRIDYAIEALDWSGRSLAQAGSAATPYRISIIQARLPLEEVTPVGPAPPKPQTHRTVHFMLGAGSGAGIAKGPPVRRPSVELADGFAPSIFHFYGELGFFPAQSFMILLAARVQMIIEESDPTVQGEGSEEQFDQTLFEPMFSLRGRWLFNSGQRVRPFVGAGGGWCGFVDNCGYVQHHVSLEPVEPVKDTTREGNAHAGAETGLIFDFSPHVSLEADLFLYALFLEKSSFQIDFNTGLVFSF